MSDDDFKLNVRLLAEDFGAWWLLDEARRARESEERLVELLRWAENELQAAYECIGDCEPGPTERARLDELRAAGGDE